MRSCLQAELEVLDNGRGCTLLRAGKDIVVWVRACARVRACVRACACVYACTCGCVSVCDFVCMWASEREGVCFPVRWRMTVTLHRVGRKGKWFTAFRCYAQCNHYTIACIKNMCTYMYIHICQSSVCARRRQSVLVRSRLSPTGHGTNNHFSPFIFRWGLMLWFSNLPNVLLESPTSNGSNEIWLKSSDLKTATL